MSQSIEDIVRRRFGRNHDKPCNKPDVLTCALWECQNADQCQWKASPEMRHLTVAEQQIMHRALRRSVRIISDA